MVVEKNRLSLEANTKHNHSESVSQAALSFNLTPN